MNRQYESKAQMWPHYRNRRELSEMGVATRKINILEEIRTRYENERA